MIPSSVDGFGYRVCHNELVPASFKNPWFRRRHRAMHVEVHVLFSTDPQLIHLL